MYTYYNRLGSGEVRAFWFFSFLFLRFPADRSCRNTDWQGEMNRGMQALGYPGIKIDIRAFIKIDIVSIESEEICSDIGSFISLGFRTESM